MCRGGSFVVFDTEGHTIERFLCKFFVVQLVVHINDLLFVIQNLLCVTS